MEAQILTGKILMNLTKGIVSLLFTFVIMMVTTKGMALQTFILLGEKSYALFKNSFADIWILVMLGILVIATLFSRRNMKNEIYTFPLFSLLSLLTVILISSIINMDVSSNFSRSFWILFSSYMPFFVLLIVDAFKIDKVNTKVVFRFLVVFNIFQMILGVVQYIKTDPIFAVYYKGEPILNPVFYLNGASSSNSYFLAMGAKVRAFGMTDSGLTLGLIALFMLSVVIFSEKLNKTFKILFSILCFAAIYMTLTRVIYLASLVLLFFAYLIKTNKYKLLKLSYFITLGIQILLITVFQEAAYVIVNFVTNGAWNLDSLKSRIDGVHFFWNISNMNIWKFLFGSNITARLNSLQSAYSIDNEFFKIFLDIGIVGYLILIIFFTKVVFKYLREILDKKDKNGIETSFVCFLLTFPFLGISNVVNYFYLPMLTILVLTRGYDYIQKKNLITYSNENFKYISKK